MNLARPLRTTAVPALLTVSALVALTACGTSEADSAAGARRPR